MILVYTLTAYGLFFSILITGLELVGWLHVRRPFDSYIPSWQFHHMRKPNTVLDRMQFLSLIPDLAPVLPASARWKYNSEGWPEDHDIDPAKPADTYRIFYLGDSFTEGLCLQEQSMPRLVGNGLAPIGSRAGLRFEVVNTGVAGYSPTIYYLLLRYKLLDYDPDLIVINIDMTDESEEWRWSKSVILDKEDNPLALPFLATALGGEVQTAAGIVKATPLTRLFLFLYRYSYFFNFILYLDDERPPETSSKTVEYKLWSWCKDEWTAQTVDAVAILFDRLKRTKELLSKRGIKTALTSVPHYTQYHGDSEGRTPPLRSARPHRELARISDELGVPFLNGYEALRPEIEGSRKDLYSRIFNLMFDIPTFQRP